MKILSLNHKPPFPTVDGGTAASAALLRALAEAGHCIEVLCYATDRHPVLTSQLPAGIRQGSVEVRLGNTRAAARAAIARLRSATTPPLLLRYQSSRYLQALRKSLRAFNPDAVLVDGLPPTIWLSELAGQTILYRAHNAESVVLAARANDPETSRLHKLLATSKRAIRLTRRWERQAAQVSDRVLAISKGVALHYCDLVSSPLNANGDSEQIVSLPVPMPTGPEPQQLPASIFHLGAMDWWPNQQGLRWFLQEVWPTVLQAHPNLAMHVAGRNAERWLAKESARGTFTNNVQVDGWVADAAEYMRAHGILVAPVFEGSGVKIKVLEAMAQGRAVLTTDHGATGLSAESGQHLLIANTPAQFSSSLARLLSSPALRMGLGRAALAMVEKEHHASTIVQRFCASVS